MAAEPCERFSTPAIVLHWTVAAFLLFNLYLGLKMDGLNLLGLKIEGASGLSKFTVFQLHKSVGFTVLGLSLLRLGFRLFGGRPPPYPAEMKPWEKALAKITHGSFYALMLGLPLTGWVIVSASPTNIPTLLYKKLPVPHLGFVHELPMATRRSLEGGTGEVHQWLAWITIALIVLHVGAALKHQFWDRDSVLHQMLPLVRAPRRT